MKKNQCKSDEEFEEWKIEQWMVSDGDSKAFNAVENTYNECKVEKLDCVGHVQKRMGKQLMNLKSTTKGMNKNVTKISGKNLNKF